jgi:hypothetical protein
MGFFVISSCHPERWSLSARLPDGQEVEMSRGGSQEIFRECEVGKEGDKSNVSVSFRA